MKTETQRGTFAKQYTLMIDTVPVPEDPVARAELVMKQVTPVINQILLDAMSVAIGTWPTPEKPSIRK